ncbi:MAG: isopenicillin N synthase family dioxygenase [Acidimicrobiales bacterium]
MTSSFSRVPVVSLAPWSGDDDDRRALADEVRRHCHEIGFLTVVDHGVDARLISDVFDTMRRLFALPEAEKRRIDKHNSPHFRGWEATGSEYTNNRRDVREQVDLWSEWPARPAGTQPAYLRLLGPNQWFPEEVLPGYRDLLGRWFDQMGGLARGLMAVMAVGLGLAPDAFEERFGAERMSLTKLIHYPPTPRGEAGVNAHHDAGFLTILAPGETPGLQVQNGDGDWVPVEAAPGSLVINLGEMLQGMTANYFVATPHRVITDTERYSAAYFHGPALDTPLVPMPLAAGLLDAVRASERHATAGFMASRDETLAGVADMASGHRPDTYGEQIWNYFSRSYPDLVAAHHPDLVTSAG